MKAIRLMAVLIIAGVACFAATAQATPTQSNEVYGMSVDVFYTNLGGGLHEYQYDVFGNGDNVYWDYLFLKFEFGDNSEVADHILNMYDPGTGPELREYWCVNGNTDNNGGDGWYGVPEAGPQPSYGDNDANTWIILPDEQLADDNWWGVDPTYSMNEGFANPFHLPNDYAFHISHPLNTTGGDAMWGVSPAYAMDRDGDGLDDDLFFDSDRYYVGGMFGYPPERELLMTVRIVSDLGPIGEVSFEGTASGGIHLIPIVGPGVPEPATMSLLALGGIAALLRRRK